MRGLSHAGELRRHRRRCRPGGVDLGDFLARDGLSVLLLDRARFPRDKPCGGGVTGPPPPRSFRSRSSPSSKTSSTASSIGLSYSPPLRAPEREAADLHDPARCWLDAFLVERAREAGAVFREWDEGGRRSSCGRTTWL